MRLIVEHKMRKDDIMQLDPVSPISHCRGVELTRVGSVRAISTDTTLPKDRVTIQHDNTNITKMITT
jgi:hypothetical protein